MRRDSADILERGRVRGVEGDELVVGARQYAVAGSEDEIAGDRNAGARGAFGSDDEHGRAGGVVVGRLRRADHRGGIAAGGQEQGRKRGAAEHHDQGSSREPILAAVSTIQW